HGRTETNFLPKARALRALGPLFSPQRDATKQRTYGNFDLIARKSQGEKRLARSDAERGATLLLDPIARARSMPTREHTRWVFSIQGHPMDDLFVHPLKDIYHAEKRIVGALPHMIEKTTSPRRGRSSTTK